MSGLEIVCGVIMLIISVAIIVLVSLQHSPKSGGVASALSGGDSFFSKNKSRTKDALLSNTTKIAGVLFFAVTIVIYAILSRTA